MSPELSAFLASWIWDPTVLGGLALSAVLYVVGWRRLAQRSRGKGVLPTWRAWCFGAALLSVWIALLSPIAVYSELFFFMHMTQHLMLMVVVAPLMWLGAPLIPVLWALPRRLRVPIGSLFVPGNPLGRLFGFLTSSMVAMTIYIVTVGTWHVPPLYDAAQGRTLIHNTEHLFFLGAALLFWWPVVHPSGGKRRLSYGAAILYFFPPMLEGNLIGALLTFADRPLYATYINSPRVWGISVLQDQQLAGLLMWVPGGLVYAIPVFILMVLMFRQEQRSQDTRLRYNGAGAAWPEKGDDVAAQEVPHHS